MVLSYKGDPTLFLTVARLYNSDLQDEKKVRGLFDYLDSNQVYVNFHPTHSFANFSFHEAAEGLWAKDKIENQIVLIGRDTQGTTKDYVKTPFSRDVVAMPTLEFNANMLETLIENSAMNRA